MPRGIKVTKSDKYTLTISMNGEVFDIETDNIKEELAKFTPDQVFTEVYVTIRRGLSEIIRRLTLPRAKKLFRDPEQQEIFVANLLF